MNEPTSIKENIIYQIGLCQQIIYSRISQVFQEKGFEPTVEQFAILTLLWYEDGMNQQQIANQIKRNKTTITRVINTMIRNNLVVRIADKSDKRQRNIHLTHKGRALENEMVEASSKVYLAALDGLTEGQIVACTATLHKILINLE